MTPDLDALLALANTAPPGPWTLTKGAALNIRDGKGRWHLARDCAAFIAAANPETVKALIERVREAERIAGKRKAEACLDCIARAERAEAGAAQLREALEEIKRDEGSCSWRVACEALASGEGPRRRNSWSYPSTDNA